MHWHTVTRLDGGAMQTSRVARLVTRILVALALVGCGGVDIGTVLVPGGRALVVEVANHSSRPATLVVAEDGPVMGQAVGTASPGVVPPGATVDVTFIVPPDLGWAIFVNPGSDVGPLVVAPSVPRTATGRMPFTIIIGANGAPFLALPSPMPPGYFGDWRR